MQLKYVGDMPIVSMHGVTFDHTQPDKYTYLHATIELLEALSYGPSETTEHLYKIEGNDMTSSDLLVKLKKYVANIDEIAQKAVKHAEELVDDLERRVNENSSLTDPEKEAWLGNIHLMREYYLQYVTNKTAYEAALDALADEVHYSKVKQVKVPMFRNYGIVLHDLTEVLQLRKSPIDSKIDIALTPQGLVATVDFYHA